MKKILISLFAVALVSGCTQFPGVHQIEIQQGNVVTQKMINQIRPGMSKNQVRFILGTPLVIDTFSQERWDYLYTMGKGGEMHERKRLTLRFEQDRLVSLGGDYRPDRATME